jgi:hypothetical protein
MRPRHAAVALLVACAVPAAARPVDARTAARFPGASAVRVVRAAPHADRTELTR